jgi:hypothetical protein
MSEAFDDWSNRALAVGGLRAGLLGLATMVLGLTREPFAILYAAHLGLGMVVVGTTMYVVDQRLRGRGERSDGLVAALALSVMWLLFVFLPIVAMWTSPGRRGHIVLVGAAVREWGAKVLSLVALLTAVAVAQAKRYARNPDPPGPTLFKPILRRALSVAAFVFFGPSVCAFLTAAQLPEPVAVATAFAFAEAYPFLATLVDRFLDRGLTKADPAGRLPSRKGNRPR